jgi:hypothetical protein
MKMGELRKRAVDDLNSSDGFSAAWGSRRQLVKRLSPRWRKKKKNERTEIQTVLEKIAMTQAMPK